MKYLVEIDVMDSILYTVNTDSCEEHAKELAIQQFKQDYPDLSFCVTNCEEENE